MEKQQSGLHKLNPKSMSYILMLFIAMNVNTGCNSYESPSESKSKNLPKIEKQIRKKEKKIEKLQTEVKTLKEDKGKRERTP